MLHDMWRHCNNQEVFCWQSEFALDTDQSRDLRVPCRCNVGTSLNDGAFAPSPNPQWVMKGSAYVSPSKARRRSHSVPFALFAPACCGGVLRAHVRSVPGAALRIRHRGRSEDGADLAERGEAPPADTSTLARLSAAAKNVPPRLAGQGRGRTAADREWRRRSSRSRSLHGREIASVRHLAGVGRRGAFGAEDAGRRAWTAALPHPDGVAAVLGDVHRALLRHQRGDALG